jgi:ABC-2 type transport system ATP-binding protein
MINLEHVSKSFGPIEAVKDLSLSITKGELFCFLGPNGAGKTTTIKMLCGLLRPTSGQIRIGGLDLRRDLAATRPLIGYIPDSPFLYERLTPLEFFEFIGDLYNIPRARVLAERDAAFHLFGLNNHAHSLIKDLSHGFRQRVIYAVTFLHTPQVLFVDEPFVGLDPFSIRLIRNLLRQKAREGMTIFFTTHILALAEHLADRIGIIAGGRLVALGTLDELKTRSAVKGQLEDIFLSLTKDDDHA